jgi:2-amino-4-hydroxy-6-hydroxymethyldihydropteridine diphosphokinase
VIHRVAVSLGSNLGDRRANLDVAIDGLRALLENVTVSHYYQTTPVGVSGPQPLYLNAAVVGDTVLSPGDLLRALLTIEESAGRERPYRYAPRTLDLDLVLFGDRIVDEPDLIVPHPRFRERRFVLEPLAEIAPDLRDPVSGKTVSELLTLVS